MATPGTETTLIPLKSARDELILLNRTVSHCLILATDKNLLSEGPLGQHVRRVPFIGGARRDAYFWDSWDWSVRGEDDLRRFFEIAQRIGGHLYQLEATEAANLIPGTVEEIVGRRTNLFLPDYWLYVMHHLGWTGQLPYECHQKWKAGNSFADETFSVTSRLPVNVVQASIDALTVLIDAASHQAWETDTPETKTENNGLEQRKPPDNEAGNKDVTQPPVSKRRSDPPHIRKRSDRAVSIERLKKELEEHLRAARDYAQANQDHGRDPELLPRPSRRELGERVGISESAVSRCFSDPAATELNLYWETAEDLEAILKFVRR